MKVEYHVSNTLLTADVWFQLPNMFSFWQPCVKEILLGEGHVALETAFRAGKSEASKLHRWFHGGHKVHVPQGMRRQFLEDNLQRKASRTRIFGSEKEKQEEDEEEEEDEENERKEGEKERKRSKAVKICKVR